MDPQLQTLGIELADAAVRNTAGAIADRIGAAKARKRDQDTIAELEEIVSGLLSDKSELVRIAQAYEQELVAQRISQTDIEYISSNFVPLLKQLMESAANESGEDPSSAEAILEIVQPILSVETVTVLQLIGFNFRKAIGEPLTELVSGLIRARAQVDTATALQLQKLAVERDLAYLAIAQDPEAAARLAQITGQT